MSIEVLKERLQATDEMIKSQTELCEQEPESFAFELALESLKSRRKTLFTELFWLGVEMNTNG